jgi:hypothetical protein
MIKNEGHQTCKEVSRLVEETGSDITHVSFFEFVVHPIHTVNTHILESVDDGRYVKAHVAKAVDKDFAIATVSADY